MQECKISRKEAVQRHGQFAVQRRRTRDLGFVHTGRASVTAHVSIRAEGKIAADRESTTWRKRAINSRYPRAGVNTNGSIARQRAGGVHAEVPVGHSHSCAICKRHESDPTLIAVVPAYVGACGDRQSSSIDDHCAN